MTRKPTEPKEPIAVATEPLTALVAMLGNAPSPEDRFAGGMPAAQVELARRLAGIELSLNLGILVRTTPE